MSWGQPSGCRKITASQSSAARPQWFQFGGGEVEITGVAGDLHADQAQVADRVRSVGLRPGRGAAAPPCPAPAAGPGAALACAARCSLMTRDQLGGQRAVGPVVVLAGIDRHDLGAHTGLIHLRRAGRRCRSAAGPIRGSLPPCRRRLPGPGTAPGWRRPARRNPGSGRPARQRRAHPDARERRSQRDRHRFCDGRCPLHPEAGDPPVHDVTVGEEPAVMDAVAGRRSGQQQGRRVVVARTARCAPAAGADQRSCRRWTRSASPHR